jgi:hypothetical protein
VVCGIEGGVRWASAQGSAAHRARCNDEHEREGLRTVTLEPPRRQAGSKMAREFESKDVEFQHPRHLRMLDRAIAFEKERPLRARPAPGDSPAQDRKVTRGRRR